MYRQLKFNFYLFSLGLILLSLLQSCAPPQINSKTAATLKTKKSEQTKQPDPMNFELVPTYQEDLVPKNSEIKYQKPETEIKTDQALIHLNQVKMSKVALTYNSNTKKLIIQGQAEIMSENQKSIAENSFYIIGKNADAETVIRLTSENKEKINSSLKPVIRAEATCFSGTTKGELDCSRAIIDFFIAYKQKIYTEQMEVKVQALPQIPVLPSEPATSVKNSDDIKIDPSNVAELQKEDSEDSVPGRFEGQIKSVDLTQIFEKDDDIQTILKPKTNLAKDKAITNNIAQTILGTIRPKNQAIGYPNNGILHNATSLLVKQQSLNKKAFFEIAFPQRQRYFATYEMAEILLRMGEYLNFKFNKKLTLSDISKLKGGLLAPHLSHQIGMDADVGYPSTDEKIKFPVVVEMGTRKFNSSVFSVAKTYDLLKFAYQQNDLKIDRIFIDRSIKSALCEYAKAKGELAGKDKELVQNLFKSMQHVKGHGDHFHLRLKCTPAHPACRQKLYLENQGCL